MRTKYILMLFLLSVVTPQVLGETTDGLYEKEPRAIEILRRADAAIREIPGLSFHTTYVGSFTARGRVNADVLLRRDGGTDDVMGTIGYTARLEVDMLEAPYAREHLPHRFELVDSSRTGAMLVDRTRNTLRTATGLQRMALNFGGVGTAILPQYLRPEPLQMEIDDSIGAAYLGTEVVGGVESHVVWLKFEDTSGFGEQLLYFGVEDHLMRKATLNAPKTVIRPASDDIPEATYPSIHFELTMSDLRIVPNIDDARFQIDRNGLAAVDLDDPPAVGDSGPQWTLRNAAGGTISAADLQGEVAYLFFWASWCPNCHVYMPQVQKIHDELDGVRVIAVNAFDRDDALEYIRRLGYTFEVALDGDDLLGNRLQFIGQPALVILDRDGVIRYREMVPRLNQATEVRALLEELVSGD